MPKMYAGAESPGVACRVFLHVLRRAPCAGDLVTEAAETPAAPDADAYAAALEELSGCIRNYRGFHKRVTKTDYVPAFDRI